ncbi:MAG: type I-C CRISPR-associated endonuclease Cas1c [Oscillospiraceae bacterium]|nr:type I-C CRISPR-associated endonuclease Cas1c [Oscillospiraceae bacterium]
MRKMLNTLFVTSEDSYLSLKNLNVVIHYSDERTVQIPLIGLEEIVSFSYKGASPDLIGKCAELGIGVAFFSPRGKFLARATGRTQGNVLLRKEQYRISDSEERSCLIARNFIFGKLYNSRWNLERTIRDHGLRVDKAVLESASGLLNASARKSRDIVALDSLRGIEGEAATRYFAVFNELILNQKEDFVFHGRSRRPPLDEVNAMLSFGYRILANECSSALCSVGLDPYVGFLHRDRPGRESLALDLMEETRSLLVDRMVITLINTKMIKKNNFKRLENGVVLLNDAGRKVFLEAWQKHKREEIVHPFLGEKIQWGLVPYVQSLLLARHIRGDLDQYPPFLWK